MNDLEQLFASFEEKKHSEEGAKQTRQQQEGEFLDKTRQAFDTVVIPTLQEIANGIIQRGYQASVKTSDKAVLNPSAELSFTPVSLQEQYPSIFPSTLSFTHIMESGKIKITNEVRTKEGGKPGALGANSPSVDLRAISPDFVRQAAMRFIEAVLKAN